MTMAGGLVPAADRDARDAATVAIGSDCVSATILLDGGILWDALFQLADGRRVAPLAKAPWSEDDLASVFDEPAYIRKLGGAFLGLPFGGRAIEVANGGWSSDPGEAPLHGRCAAATWHVVRHTVDDVTIGLIFPISDAIERVEQRFTCAAAAARIDISITITARRAATVAVGYHPVLRLPEEVGALELIVDFASGHTAPLDADGARTSRGAGFTNLSTVPARGGGMVDLSHLPLAKPAEDLLLLGRVCGPLVARYLNDGYVLTVDWDREILPNCLVWYHDRAADAHPWNGCFRGVGIEPSASAFDFSAATSRGPNPLMQAGEVTSITLSPDAATTITCSLGVEAFA